MASGEHRSTSPALSHDTPPLVVLAQDSASTSSPVPPLGPLQPKWSCSLCKKHHSLRFCRRFKRLDGKHRLRAIIKYGYCMRCLSPTHITSKCTSSMKCPRCNAGHHYLLHDDSRQSIQARKAAPRSIISKSLRNSVRPIQMLKTPAEVLLPTCQLSIWCQGQQIVIRALIDQCSGRNYILRKLPSFLGSVHLPGDEGQDVELLVIAINGSNQRLSITAQITNRLQRGSTTFSCPPSIKGHFENLKLADNQFDQPGSLQMVLGMPVYHKIMRSTVLSQPGFPQPQDSFFGWVLSGMCNL